jgi:hypothetical protein
VNQRYGPAVVNQRYGPAVPSLIKYKAFWT